MVVARRLRFASIGTVDDSYDNAHATSVMGLHEAACTLHEGPWRGVDDLELARLSWVHWFHETRLHGSIGHVPPCSRGRTPPSSGT